MLVHSPYPSSRAIPLFFLFLFLLPFFIIGTHLLNPRSVFSSSLPATVAGFPAYINLKQRNIYA